MANGILGHDTAAPYKQPVSDTLRVHLSFERGVRAARLRAEKLRQLRRRDLIGDKAVRQATVARFT